MPLKNVDKRKKYQSKYHNDWYQKNKEKRKKQIWERRNSLRKWVTDLKKNLKCNRCPENHISCLEFHHKDPAEKEGTISLLYKNGWSKKRILEEINKCEILCANCHKKEHYNIRHNLK